MKFTSKTNPHRNDRKSLMGAFLTFSIVTVLTILPAILPHAEARSKSNASHPSGSEKVLPNYDIRTDKGKWTERMRFREQAGLTASDIADTREAFVKGENELKTKIPALAIEYSETMQSPEVFSSRVGMSASFLTSPSKMPRSEALKVFLRENEQLFGLSGSTVDSLSVTADYRNPENELGFVTLEQSINHIPVFQGMLNAGFTGKGEIIRIVSNLFTNYSIETVSREFGDPVSLLTTAARYAGHELRPEEQQEPVSIDGSDKKLRFGSGDWATTAEKVYFPIEPGVACSPSAMHSNQRYSYCCVRPAPPAPLKLSMILALCWQK
ncbi:hypothetical protein [Leptolyngbya sp. 7M]|uniref:hypothetical protein n=1 Tax=Leptolyngbya sp. 7M TaxID=2812896 RepID=UPI001B8A90F4|nr:hypothetical protein [Leptolyngbya sp. 7M]QYO64736.1 hypothetical protein JVX88_34930 [Leptolyngbya sp. 7M]